MAELDVVRSGGPGIRPESAQQARLLRLLRDLGPSSRAELGEAAGLSRSRLAVEVDRLLQSGAVVQDGLAASRGGRRSHRLRLSPRIGFLGVDIGATSLDVAVAGAELELLAHVSTPVDVRDGPTEVLSRAVEMAGRALRESGIDRPLGAGIGLPGPVRFPDGRPVAPPIMPGWDDFPVRDHMAAALGCPVLVDNDVNIMALGELHAGIARSVRDFLFVKIGTGIGCGIVLGSRVHRGVNGSAGDIGHIQVDRGGPPCSCGNTGCLEAYFGGPALVRDAMEAVATQGSPGLEERIARRRKERERAGLPLAVGAGGGSAAEAPGGVELTPEDVAAAATAGDRVALSLIRQGGRRVGQVVAGQVSFLNPGMIVLGGGLVHLGPVLLATIRTEVYRRSLPLATGQLPVVVSELGGTAGVIGAARLISDHVLEVPAPGGG
ncbi:ROK family protein [Allostreptomyces psammosilenae]|uniref:Putative NBD/HSP70 family sugar kinase n=1 Tax=Allostreptomyces psammosilenae TaxID=1892865 RepID=A0A853A8E0_9ACTN|nr:ROK family protein [Allostreptomyces psammosilenae]NYI06702.1 putative NBD/HSP70 family sugar kinase [Allostreptomyces psammosilenae]